jgi:hypothetical protein
MQEVTALLKSEHRASHTCRNTWSTGRWWFTGLLYEWVSNGHCQEKERRSIILQIDRKLFDGQWDEIQGIFHSFERHFLFNLEWNKGRHNNSKLQSMADTNVSWTKALSYAKVSKQAIMSDVALLITFTEWVTTTTTTTIQFIPC